MGMYDWIEVGRSEVQSTCDTLHLIQVIIGTRYVQVLSRGMNISISSL